MGTCLERSNEKNFLNIVNLMLKELNLNYKFSTKMLQDLETAYEKLTGQEQKQCLELIYEVVSEEYDAAMYLFASMLKKLQDRKILVYIERMLLCKEYSLWKRLNDRCQLRIFLFTNHICNQEYEEYGILSRLNENFLNEIQEKMNCTYPYIPFHQRRKKIVIIMSDVISIYHAPTKRLRFIYQCYQNMGYEVTCFVCHIWGTEGWWDWNESIYNYNFTDETGFFSLMLDGVKIEGFNLILNEKDYPNMLAETLGMIWRKKPEFVLEIGSETILAGLCRQFTTLVTMGCTKSLPVTNAPIIALPAEYSEKEQALWKKMLRPDQKMLEVRHMIHEWNTCQKEYVYTKETFGIPQEAFVIVIAGNRLDMEIKRSFLDILYETLDLDETFVVAVIGDCTDLQCRVTEEGKAERFFFLGMQERFKEAIAIGDVFLNPPRQGGGTGGLMAVLEEVPVITLDHCDVEANAGKEFVCGSVEEMPGLVYRYFTDAVFMEKQKENCRKAASEKTDINSEESFKKLNDTVKKYAKAQEDEENDTF